MLEKEKASRRPLFFCSLSLQYKQANRRLQEGRGFADKVSAERQHVGRTSGMWRVWTYMFLLLWMAGGATEGHSTAFALVQKHIN